MLAYHIAVRRGCDVDQPRNLAKSVRWSSAGQLSGPHRAPTNRPPAPTRLVRPQGEISAF